MDTKLRMKCLNLVLKQDGLSEERVIPIAEKYFDWARGGDEYPETDRRLECLAAAVSEGWYPDKAILVAKKYYKWVKTGKNEKNT